MTTPAALLSLLALALPLWVLPGSHEAFLLPKTALLATGAAAAAAAWVLRGPKREALGDPRAWCWAALLAVFLVSYLASPWKAAGAEAFALSASWAAAGLVAALSLRGERDGERLAAAAGLAAALAAAWSLRQGPGSPSTLGNPSFLGSYLAGCGPLLLWLAASRRGARGLAWTAGLILATAALAATGTRSAWLAAAVSWPWAWVALGRDAEASARRGRVAAGCALALAAGLWWSAPFTAARAASAARLDTAAVQGRLLMWRAAREMLLDRPALGQGPGGYHFRYLEHQARLLDDPDNAARRRYWTHTHSAHDAYLQLAAETGLAGLAAFLAVLAAAFLAWRRRLASPLRAAWAAAALALLADGVLGLPLQLPASALLLALALNLASAPAEEGSASPAKTPRARLALAGLLGLALLLAPARLWLRQAAELRVAEAMGAVARRDFDRAEAALRAAVALSPSHGKARLFLGNALLLLGEPGEAAEQFEAAMRLLSDPNIPYDLGLARLEQGLLSEARRWCLAALRLKPAFPEALATLGYLDWREGRVEQAEDRYKRSLELAPANPAVTRELGLLYAHTGRRSQALALLRQAQGAYPQDREVAAAVATLERMRR